MSATHELAAGAQALRELLELPPYFEVVALVGSCVKAEWGRHIAPIVGEDVMTMRIWHPSPLSLYQPLRRVEFSDSIRDLAETLRQD